MYTKKTKARFTFKIKAGQYHELLIADTMRLLGGTK